MYVCGPTTYNYIHLGNARPLVVFDTIRRYLIYRGYDVFYVQNFTDVDDKIINRAWEEGVEPGELAEHYIAEYFKDAQALMVMDADLHPRASQHIQDMIEVISFLIEREHAYERDGDVYFRVSSFPSYGKLSGRSLDEMLSGARVEIDERKENPVDFALWKKAKPGEPAWDSPWGKGRPGWHIECSVMSMKYLGSSLDIHGGGADLIFPHHDNEIAQSEAYSGHPFVRYWIHNGFITVNQEKMSKSLGNFFIVREILEKFPASVVRFYLLSTHYRSPLDFDDIRLQEAGRAFERLKNSYLLLHEACQEAQPDPPGADGEKTIKELEELRAAFVMAMDDDFNTSRAIGHLFEIAHLINGYLSGAGAKSRAVLELATDIWTQLNGILGLNLEAKSPESHMVEEVVKVLVEFRERARQEKDFVTGDLSRELLKCNGIIVEDSRDGSRFRFQKKVELDSFMSGVIGLRQELRKRKCYAQADRLREGLLLAGIVLEDTREGCRFRLQS